MDLTTRCPQCGTTFSASLEQLQLRKGYIRCINCAHIFDGFDAVVPASPSLGPGPSVPVSSGPSPSQGSKQGQPPVSSHTTVESPHVASAQPAVQRPAERPVDSAAKPPAPPLAKPPVAAPPKPPVESPAEPVFVMPSVVRQRSPGKSSPVHTVTVPPRLPSDSPRPAFTISGSSPRGEPHDEGPVFSVGDAVHVRPEPAFRGVAPTPGGPQRRTHEPQIPIIPRNRNAAARVFVADPSGENPAPAYEPGSRAAPRQRAAGAIYVEPRRDDADSTSRAGAGDFVGPERPAYYGVVRAFWAVLIAAGLVLLLGQLLYVYRAQIANTVPVFRPVLEQACERLRCKVPYTRRIDLISIMSSSLRAVPPAEKGQDAAPDSMMLQLTMRNEHDKPQEWPTLVLDLTDFSGTLVVRKNLPPQLYLPSEVLQHPFAPASEITVNVPISMNGQKINGYQLAKFFQ